MVEVICEFVYLLLGYFIKVFVCVKYLEGGIYGREGDLDRRNKLISIGDYKI